MKAILEDAKWAPSWCNTSPYFLAVATGSRKNRLKTKLLAKFDAAAAATTVLSKIALYLSGGAPDGDFDTQIQYSPELNKHRRACGFGLYDHIGIKREEKDKRNAQVRRNFEFFGAPVVFFVFVQGGMSVFSPLDVGFYLQTLLLSAHARGLGTCAQGALAMWKSPVLEEFPEVPTDYKLICGVSMGYASNNAINAFNPGRRDVNGTGDCHPPPS
jgi:nitroreductase